MYNEHDMDASYAAGSEDMAQKVVEFIRGSDYEVTAHDIAQFIEWELGYSDLDDAVTAAEDYDAADTDAIFSD